MTKKMKKNEEKKGYYYKQRPKVTTVCWRERENWPLLFSKSPKKEHERERRMVREREREGVAARAATTKYLALCVVVRERERERETLFYPKKEEFFYRSRCTNRCGTPRLVRNSIIFASGPVCVIHTALPVTPAVVFLLIASVRNCVCVVLCRMLCVVLSVVSHLFKNGKNPNILPQSNKLKVSCSSSHHQKKKFKQKHLKQKVGIFFETKKQKLSQ